MRMWRVKCLLYRDLEEKYIAVHKADRQAILEETAKLGHGDVNGRDECGHRSGGKSKAVAGLVTEAVEKSVLPSAVHCDTAEWHECFIVPKMKSNSLLKI